MPDIDVMLHKAALRVREGTLPDGRHLRYAAETVNGVTVPGMGTIEFLPEYQDGPHASDERLTLSWDRAHRLGRFALTYLSLPMGDQFDCMSFVNFVTGFTQTVRYWMPHRLEWQQSVSHVEPGEPYVLQGKHGEIPHYTLGTNRPTHTFGVIGPNAPMLVTPIPDVMHIYNAQYIHPLTSVSELDEAAARAVGLPPTPNDVQDGTIVV